MGHPSKDRTCFGPDTDCVHEMAFLSVVKSEDFGVIKGSGSIGLSPNPHLEKRTDSVPGFIYQLSHNKDYSSNFSPVFSIYLSNDESLPGKMTFGGYDTSFARPNAPISWLDTSANLAYWTVNGQGVSLGNESIFSDFQQVIFDNGMSLAKAPEKQFIKLVKALLETHGVKC